MGNVSSTTADFDAWRKQGIELRKKYETEMKQLHARQTELQKLLATLPKEEGREIDLDAPPPSKGLTEQIRKVVVESPGLNAVQIWKKVKVVFPLVDARKVHATLSRLKKDGTLRTDGARGKQTYFLVTPSAGTNGSAKEARHA